MTMREKMSELDENLGWCKPISFNGGEIVIALNEGAVVSIQDHGEDVPTQYIGNCVCGYTDDQIKAVARRVNGDYDLYSGWDDVHILLEGGGEELPCRECPWFGICAAMDEEVEEW